MKRSGNSDRRNSRLLLCEVLVATASLSAAALAVPAGLSNGSNSYIQDFASLPNQNAGVATIPWLDDSTLGGWYAQNLAGTATAPASLTANNGGNFSSIQSLGSNLNSATDLDITGLDRAFGTTNSQGTSSIRYGLVLRNTGTTELTSLSISYTGEQWRQSVNTTGLASVPENDFLKFGYKLASSTPDSSTVLAGTFVDAASLDFYSPKPLLTSGSATRLDGNVAANRSTLSTTITGLSVAPNSYVVLRWFDANTLTSTGAAVSDNTLAIDDLSINASFGAAVWNTDADESWQTAVNWSANFVPTGANVAVQLGSAITAARTITLVNPVTLGKLTFDNTFSYTLGGAGSLAFDGPTRTLEANAGSHVIGVPVTTSGAIAFTVQPGAAISLNGSLGWNGATLTKTGAGSLNLTSFVGTGTIALASGSVKLTGAAADSLLAASPAVTVDLQAKAARLGVDFTGATTTLADLRAALVAGLADGFASGPIRTTLATAGRTVGYAPDGTGYVVGVTLPGDANLSGVVGFDDLVALAQNYGTLTGGNWFQGDANYDGAINFGDLVALAQNYNAAALGSFEADWALAQSLVPEPTGLFVMAAAIGMGLRRHPKGVAFRSV